MSEQRIEYVGFWVRVGATLVDTIFLLLLTVPPLWAINSWTTSGFVNGTAELLLAWIAPAVIVIVLWLRKQATPGKMVFSAPGHALGRLRQQEAGLARQACRNGRRARQGASMTNGYAAP
jgi:RDD family